MVFSYLDPGSGSLIASALVGGVAAVGVAVKQARFRVAGKFKKRSGEPEAEETSVESEPSVDASASDS
jgi:hypothetical protein